MNIYVSEIEVSYKDTILGHLGNSGTSYLLLYIVKCWCACAVDEDKWARPMVIYYSVMMYKYYYCIIFTPIKHNKEGK